MLPIQDTTLTAKTDGTIQTINFKEGQTVQAGQLLIQLGNKQQRAEYIKDKANLQIANNNLKRNKLLNKEHIVSNEDLNTIKTLFEQDKAAVIASHSALSDTELKAPFAGVAGRFIRQVGDYVSTGTTLVRITNTKQLIVEYQLPQHTINQIKPKQPVTITLLNENGVKSKAHISFIDDNIDPSSQTFTVHALLNNPNHLFHPGNFVSIQQTLSKTNKQILIPIQAVKNSFDGRAVFVARNHHAVLQSIIAGKIHGNKIVAKAGLNTADKIIIKSDQALEDGMLIKSTPA